MSTEDIDRPKARRGTRTAAKAAPTSVAAASSVSPRKASVVADTSPPAKPRSAAKAKTRVDSKATAESTAATKEPVAAKLKQPSRRGKAPAEESAPARQRGSRSALPVAPATHKVPAARIAAAKQALAKTKTAISPPVAAPAEPTAAKSRKPKTAPVVPPAVSAPVTPPLRVEAPPVATAPSPAKAAPTPEPEQPSASSSLDFEAFAGNLARMIEEGGKAMAAYLRPREEGTIKDDVAEDIADVVKTIGNVAEYWLVDPQRTVEAQSRLIGGYLSLWSSTLKRLGGEATPPVAAPAPRDGRFVDKEWTNNLFFDTLKQTYLITANWAEKMVEEAEIEKHTKHKAEFYVRQIASAVSPSNFVLTNPELLRTTLESNGENLVRGMKMLAEDIEAGGGDLKIRQTDSSKFKVGVNLATTPGKVIFQNELMQLIQYSPTTPTVQSLPLVIVPPWINKYYVLDLNAEKSFVRWAVDQGLTVFIISWVNPDPSLGTKGFDAYMHEGVLKAIEITKQAAGTDETHVMGYCVGGTMLAMTLAWLAADHPGAIRDAGIRSASFLTTQVDFTHAGDLKVFIDEEQISHLERKMLESGVMEGGKMARAFNMLRANDLIWPYVVNNYLKGQAPFPFDILYWNSDSTRLPAANHSFYLRNCYLDNRFATGKLRLDGRKLDLAQVSLPIYSLATREDHIAPAQSVFLGMQKFGTSSRFVLAGSGHIAGVVNPPARGKYQYWTGDAPEGKLEDWIAGAQMHPGSWWPDWYAWIDAQDGKQVPARIPGEGALPAIEDAPGSYVKVNS